MPDAPPSPSADRAAPPVSSDDPSVRIDALRTIAASLLLITVGVAGYWPSLSEDRARARARAAVGEPVERLDRTFAALKPFLPPTGHVGYLEPKDWPSADAIRTFYLAEYSLTPRVVVFGTTGEFLIVVPATGVAAESAADDPRLSGFALVRRFGQGVLLFRRVR